MSRFGQFIILLACLSLCWAGVAAAQMLHPVAVAEKHDCGGHTGAQEKPVKPSQCCKYDCCLTKLIPVAAVQPVIETYRYSYADVAGSYAMVTVLSRLDKPPKAV